MNFDEAIKRGEIAEQIIIERFKRNGRIVYEPSNKGEKGHLIDMFVTHPKENKMIGVEIKVQRQFNWHDVPTYTLPHKNWNEYLEFYTTYGLELMLLFIDTQKHEIMFASMSTLIKTEWEQTTNGKLNQYPLLVYKESFKSWRHDKILLPVNRFQVFDELTEAEIKQLNNY